MRLRLLRRSGSWLRPILNEHDAGGDVKTTLNSSELRAHWPSIEYRQRRASRCPEGEARGTQEILLRHEAGVEPPR